MIQPVLAAYKVLASTNKFSWELLETTSNHALHDIRKHYPTRESLDEGAWWLFALEAVRRTQEEAVYAEYTARERMLSFYFTLSEVLKADKDYALMHLRDLGLLDFSPPFLTKFIEAHAAFTRQILEAGMEAGEIPRRMWLSDQYAKVHFLQTLFVLRTWAADKTETYAETDSAIEKAVNLGFDLMERNFLDSAWDFGKYLWSRN
jgi:hypothetical protein